MSQNNKEKIVKYRKPLNLNIGMIIFAVILIYIIICTFMYFTQKHIEGHQVKAGSLSTNNIYQGIALRKEEIVSADQTGYINYYAREGERVGVGNLVYTLDESGKLADYLNTSESGSALSGQDLSELKTEILGFVNSFQSDDFTSVYDFKYDVQGTVLKLANTNMLQSIGELGTSANTVNYSYAPMTGIVSYWVDGYESLQPQDVTAAVFDAETTTYEKRQMLSNTLMALEDPVYKLSTSENWSLVIPIEAVRGAKLQEEGFVKVRFLKNQYESWGEVKLLSNADGNTYLQLSFTNSMITFVGDRFLDVELILEDEKGLKIPNSSIVQKEFFLIPEAFVTPGGNNGGDSVLRQSYLENGEISSETLEIEVYNFDSESREYYVDSSILNAGDILYKQGGQETYTVSKRATLIGVYNMNKGYADFKQINILYQNDEYAIVKSNTKYGLNVYDYIVLNADSVSDDQFINQ